MSDRGALTIVALAFATLPGAALPQIPTLPAILVAPGEPVRFGTTLEAVEPLSQLGVKPSFALLWVGVWNQKHGWANIDAWLDRAYAANVTPVIQFWYWGDAISPENVERGGHDELHHAWVSRPDWDAAAAMLAAKIDVHMHGRETLVVVESEFNKNGVTHPEYASVFDGYLREKMDLFHAVAGVKTVVGFGNWNPPLWNLVPRTIAAADLVGFQTLRASTRNSLDANATVEAIHEAAARIRTEFGKPTILYDLGLSSHPEPEALAAQASTLMELFRRLSELQSLGLEGVIYRSFTDNARADPRNHFGVAEQHWGLRYSDGTAKAALDVWVRGVRAATALPAPDASPRASTLVVDGATVEPLRVDVPVEQAAAPS